MFYSYDILNIRKGKLALAWAAATGALTVATKRDKNYRKVMSCIVYKICEDIMSHVGASEEDESNRFSLYLSAMLMGGTVKIYRYQVKFLFESVSAVFVQLMSSSDYQKGLIDITDLPKSMKQKMTETLFESRSLSFGKPRLDFDLEMEFYPDVLSPRKKMEKRTKKAQRIPQVSDDLQREPEEEDTDLDIIFKDWPDTAVYPNVASFREITMIEEPVSTRPILPELQDPQFSLQPDDVGPLFPPEEFLKPTHSLISESVKEKKGKKTPGDKAVVQEERDLEKESPVVPPISQPEDLEAILPAPVLETPLQPVEQKQKSPPRKTAAQRVEEDKTIIEEASREKVTISGIESEILLPEIPSTAIEFRRRTKRKKLVFADRDLQIKKADFEKQIEDYSDTLREKTVQDDIIDAHWWKVMKAAQHLLQKTERRTISHSLKHLLTRNYVSNPKDGHYEMQSPPAKRKLMLQDADVESDIRGQDSEVSSLLKLSSITLDSSKVSSEKRLSLSKTSSFAVHPLSSTHQARIEEKIAEDITKAPSLEQTPYHGIDTHLPIRPTILFPSDEPQLPQEEAPLHSPKRQKTRELDAPEDATTGQHLRRVEGRISPSEELQKITVIDEIPSEKERVIKVKKPRRLTTASPPEKGLQTMTVSAEVHVQEKESIIKEKKPRRLRTASPPEKGLQTMTITAEVHVQEKEREIEIQQGSVVCDPFQELPPRPSEYADSDKSIRHGEPHLPIGDFESLNLSPIGRPRVSRLITTPEISYRKFEENVLESLAFRERVAFDSVLPEDPTRKSVAAALSYFLEQHKRRKVILTQEENYGTIWIAKF